MPPGKQAVKGILFLKENYLRWTRRLYNATIQCYLWMQFSLCEYSHWQSKPVGSFLSSLPIRGSEKGQLLHSSDLTFVSFAWHCWYRSSLSDGSLKWKQPVVPAMYLSVYWHEPSAHKYHLALYLRIEFQQLQLQAYSFMLILWIDSWLLISYDKSIEKQRQAQNYL